MIKVNFSNLSKQTEQFFGLEFKVRQKEQIFDKCSCQLVSSLPKYHLKAIWDILVAKQRANIIVQTNIITFT